MGYDLRNDQGEEFDWKAIGWWQLLSLAQASGWTSAKTEMHDRSWDGNYFMNAGQRVNAQDAAALADALEKLLSNPGRDDVARQVASDSNRLLSGEIEYSIVVFGGPVRFLRQAFGAAELDPWSFSPRSERYMREFIRFCRMGAFIIE